MLCIFYLFLLFWGRCFLGLYGDMELMEEVQLVEVVMGDSEYVFEDCERLFRVGDLVEFWEGPVVRGYRTDSGDPAYVKEIHGLG